MRDDPIALPILAVVIVVVVLCCTVATGISFCFVRSRLPRRYLYCSACSSHVGLLPLYGEAQLEVQPRPWVEVLGHNVPHNSNHLTILQESGTFQRLGMKSAQGTTEPDTAVLEVDQLQTRPMTNARPLELDPALRNQIISPTSAEVFARRDTARSKLSRMSSRRTLQFKSPVEPEQSRLGVPRQVRRSVSERMERSCRRQEEGGVTSQSEDERGSGTSGASRASRASAQTVIRVNRQARWVCWSGSRSTIHHFSLQETTTAGQ